MPTILLADDNRALCAYCQEEFEDEGYRVVTARNGAEAVRQFCMHLPDVVVLDVQMPILDGISAAAEIKAIAPGVPLVLFTSYEDTCLASDVTQLVTACVEKREDLTELKQVVAAVLAASRHGKAYRLGLPPKAAECVCRS